ncbi:MAG: TlpA family protein disulfide reductase [Bacteroidales bacterium]|nr:TlpA family protein disulfide reductase [Bacteroidales bacterium]
MKRSIIIILTVIILLSLSCKKNTESNATKKTTINTVSAEPGLNIGNKAPALSFLSPEGENYTLESLQGKLVLVDFWASWCPPCRKENPELVNTFHAFKNVPFVNGKGFTIYSVSLDKDKKSWVAAIQQDNLSWKYHVSDLKGWQSVPAAIYHVNFIPSNFLIDENGIIIAKNLRGEELKNTLEKFRK